MEPHLRCRRDASRDARGGVLHLLADEQIVLAIADRGAVFSHCTRSLRCGIPIAQSYTPFLAAINWDSLRSRFPGFGSAPNSSVPNALTLLCYYAFLALCLIQITLTPALPALRIASKANLGYQQQPLVAAFCFDSACFDEPREVNLVYSSRSGDRSRRAESWSVYRSRVL